MTGPAPAGAGARGVTVLVYPGFSEFEVTVALTLLARKFTVVNVGLSLDAVRGEGGLRVLPEVDLASVNAEDYEALIVPGAVDMAVLADVPELHVFVRALHERGRLLAAICGGPFVLGQAGVLGGPYTVTFTPEQRALLAVFPPEGFEYRDVVRSGNVITAQGHAFAEFGVTVAEVLGSVLDAQGVRAFYRGLGNADMEARQTGPEV